MYKNLSEAIAGIFLTMWGLVGNSMQTPLYFKITRNGLNSHTIQIWESRHFSVYAD